MGHSADEGHGTKKVIHRFRQERTFSAGLPRRMSLLTVVVQCAVNRATLQKRIPAPGDSPAAWETDAIVGDGKIERPGHPAAIPYSARTSCLGTPDHPFFLSICCSLTGFPCRLVRQAYIRPGGSNRDGGRREARLERARNKKTRISCPLLPNCCAPGRYSATRSLKNLGSAHRRLYIICEVLGSQRTGSWVDEVGACDN